MSSGSPASDFSVALLGEFIARGVRHIVLSPGSRSQALALAAAEFERAGHVRLHVRIDERVAGFTALGLAVETRMPVLVVTTSGTAVANLHPAVLEAHHSGVPLVLLTADRPPELRGIGSNQTTHQPGIFGVAVHLVREVEAPTASGFSADYPGELAAEILSAAAGHSSAPGPVHVNLAFREPLSSAVDGVTVPKSPSTAPRRAPAAYELPAAPGTVVIAGHAAGPSAEEAARSLGAPLLAEVTSGARFGPNLVVAYRDLLADPAFGGEVRRAIVFGHPTLSREVPALLQRQDVDVIVVRGPSPEDYDPGRRASRVVDAVSYRGTPAERSWTGSWVSESRRLLDAQTPPPPRAGGDLARHQLAVFREPVTRRMLVEAVWAATWPHDRLVLGASRLIREADRVLPGKRVTAHANRGLAGIDGTVSTATGIALAAEDAGSTGSTRVILGDLALLHDAGALLLPPAERHPRLQVIVGDDRGGTIFDGLEVAASAPSDTFDRVLYTPQDADLGALAAAYGWRHVRATNRGELDEALAPPTGPVLVEVPLTR